MQRTVHFELAVLMLALASCGSYPNLVDYRVLSGDPKKASMVLVGTIVDDKAIAAPRLSHWNLARYDAKPYRPKIQLHLVRVKIENVLRGNFDLPSVSIYYFSFTESWDSHQRLGRWNANDRQLIYAQRDEDIVRLACDGLNYCVYPVVSGYHLLPKGEMPRSFEEALAEILLTKGEGADEQAFAETLVVNAGRIAAEYAVPKLKILEASDTPAIRRSSCEALRKNFKLPCSKVSKSLFEE